MSNIPSPLPQRLAEADTETLAMERRASTRRVVAGRVTGLARSDDPAAPSNRICSLELLNMSDTGLGAILQEPLPAGTTLAVFFPPHGAEQGFDLYGTVVRCRQRDWGHEVGLRFAYRQAA